MKYYLAPMEGITTFTFRQVYYRHYPMLDRSFTPFLASKKLSSKEKKEIDPEINQGQILIPQILSNQPDTFLAIAAQLKDYGYDTVNLNLGCPSGTVVARRRGSGQLIDLPALDHFLAEIFEKCPLRISIKTRIGVCFPSEWEDILPILLKYPLEELIVHPRLQKEFYTGTPHLEAMQELLAYEKAKETEAASVALAANNPVANDLTANNPVANDQATASPYATPLCYNGDICSLEDEKRILGFLYPNANANANTTSFTDANTSLHAIMIGRGLLRRPWLIEELRSQTSSDLSQEKKRLKDFLDDLRDTYQQLYGMNADQNVLFKLKDYWNFLSPTFPESEKELKSLRKARTLVEFNAIQRDILS